MLYNNLERLVSAACVDIKHVDALGEVAYIDYIAQLKRRSHCALPCPEGQQGYPISPNL